MIYSPHVKGGVRTREITEFIDIYPTVCDLVGLNIPAHLQGASLLETMENPNRESDDFAISQYPRVVKGRQIMGYSIRKGEYRYTCWIRPGNWDEIVDQELYRVGCRGAAMENLWGNENYREIALQLKELLLNELNKPCSRL